MSGVRATMIARHFERAEGMVCDPKVREMLAETLVKEFSAFASPSMVGDLWTCIQPLEHGHNVDVNVFDEEYGAPLGCFYVVMYPVCEAPDGYRARQDCLVGRAVIEKKWLEMTSRDD